MIGWWILILSQISENRDGKLLFQKNFSKVTLICLILKIALLLLKFPHKVITMKIIVSRQLQADRQLHQELDLLEDPQLELLAHKLEGLEVVRIRETEVQLLWRA